MKDKNIIEYVIAAFGVIALVCLLFGGLCYVDATTEAFTFFDFLQGGTVYKMSNLIVSKFSVKGSLIPLISACSMGVGVTVLLAPKSSKDDLNIYLIVAALAYLIAALVIGGVDEAIEGHVVNGVSLDFFTNVGVIGSIAIFMCWLLTGTKARKNKN